jgi:TolB-like protein/Flp pilus assembly protein TadD
VETSVVTGVGSALEVRMLGALTIRRDDAAVPLPASRKARGLLAYLALAPRPVPRSQLCELLWDVPNDPRGELRWSLSKIRGVVEDARHRRIVTEGDTVRLDLTGCYVDALEAARAVQSLDALGVDRLRTLAASFAGDFLDGLEIADGHAFNGWLTAQRRRFRGCQAALLEQLAATVPDDEALGYLERWLELAPFDQRVHELLLNALARQGRIREGEEHLAAAKQLFAAECLECTGLDDAWRAARAHGVEPAARTGATPRLDAAAIAGEDVESGARTRRASVAVMPFVDWSSPAGARGGIADALAHDVITRLAKLRSLFVIAQGSVFALQERSIGPEEAGRMLNVEYVAGGSVQRQGDRVTVMVELAETRTARILWAETFNRALDDAFEVLHEIGNSIVASIASEIETSERNRAILRPPSSLNAWEAHHRGLWHMYRFDRENNERARHFFEMAVRADPTFARAYAGLSFTHFQNVFQGWANRREEVERAFETAGQSIMADDRDPAAHWAMGRALWLRGRHPEAVVELEKSVDLSPNFALAHYTLAFVHSQNGDPHAAIASADHSRALSPFDPLLFGMLGARAMALARLGRFDEAAEWSVKAAARPNAHAHILAIAAYSLALAGRLAEARGFLDAIHRSLPYYRVDDLLIAMQFDDAGAKLFRDAARRIRSS